MKRTFLLMLIGWIEEKAVKEHAVEEGFRKILREWIKMLLTYLSQNWLIISGKITLEGWHKLRMLLEDKIYMSLEIKWENHRILLPLSLQKLLNKMISQKKVAFRYVKLKLCRGWLLQKEQIYFFDIKDIQPQ
jgi:hypothetical protein